MKNKKNIIISIIVLVILLLIIIFVINSNNNDNKEVTNNKEETENKIDRTINIRINEDFSKDGRVENLENVRWHNANIIEYDDKMEIDIMLNNEEKDKKIPATTLTVNIYNEDNKIIYTKDVEMEEIPDNYGYTDLNLEFDIDEIVIIKDIEIVAKK